MAKGRKTGGRKRGVPNKVTREAREVFRRMFDGLAPEAEQWIRETAAGDVRESPEGKTVIVREPDPGKAAALLLQLAEFHLPKLARSEVTVRDLSDEAMLEELRRREESEAAGKREGPLQ